MDETQKLPEDERALKLNEKHRLSQGMKLSIAFFVGMLVSASLFGVYNLVVQLALAPHAVTIQSSSVQKAPVQNILPTPPGESQVTPEQLKNYTEAKDCSTVSQFNTNYLGGANYTMKTIDLKGGVIVASKEQTTAYIRWKTLPQVVDYQCNLMTLADIKAGDTLNIYALKSTISTDSASWISNAKLIQKVNK